MTIAETYAFGKQKQDHRAGYNNLKLTYNQAYVNSISTQDNTGHTINLKQTEQIKIVSHFKAHMIRESLKQKQPNIKTSPFQ